MPNAEHPTSTPGPVPQYPIESVDNALRVLLLLGERPELRLTEVSEYLGVASSTAHRILAMLQYRGFVQQDRKTKVYLPGTALTSVAFSILQRSDFRAALHPLLEKLNDTLRETVHLGMLIGATVQFVDAVESPQAVRVASRLGRTMPANSTSTGKALLAQLTAEAINALYPREELEGLTPKSITSRTELHRQLQLVRRRGYATSNEESEAGVASVAVAIATTTGPRLAFNVAAPASRMTQSVERRIGATLLHIADEASSSLNG